MAREFRMIVRNAETSRDIGQAVKEVGPPQRSVYRDQLRGRFAPAVLLRRQFAQFDPDTMLHGGVVQVDLKPVPHDESTAGEGQDVLHGASQGLLRPGFACRVRSRLPSDCTIPTGGRWTVLAGRPGEPRIPRPPGRPARPGT